MKKKIFNIKVDDNDCYMDAISLVDFPAVEVNWLAFNNNKPIYQKFDTDKHIITGVVCLADTPIYRYNEQYGEYYVVFEKDTILKMVQKYSQMGLFNSVNIQHDDKRFVDNVILFESYIINEERGIYAPKEFTNIPDGSWICSFKVNDDNLWNDIIEGKLKGFSLQGLFSLEEQSITSYFSKESNLLKELSMNFNIKLRNLLLRFTDMVTDKGILTIDGELKVGATVYMLEELAEDGEYTTEKEIIKVENGVITEIIVKEDEEVKEEPTKEPITEDIVEEVIVEDKPEVDELLQKIAELETILAEKETVINELTDKLKEAEDKLLMSVEKLSKEFNKETKKSIYSFKNK